jgi:hypothetical protein
MVQKKAILFMFMNLSKNKNLLGVVLALSKK